IKYRHYPYKTLSSLGRVVLYSIVLSTYHQYHPTHQWQVVMVHPMFSHPNHNLMVIIQLMRWLNPITFNHNPSIVMGHLTAIIKNNNVTLPHPSRGGGRSLYSMFYFFIPSSRFLLRRLLEQR